MLFLCKILITLHSTFRPNKNRCSTSEAESNGEFHAPLPGLTSADNLSSAVATNGKVTGKERKTSKSTFQDSPKKLPSSLKKQQSSKEQTSKEAKESCLMSRHQQQPRSVDTYSGTSQHKKMDKHKIDYYSDGGIICYLYLSHCLAQRLRPRLD